MKKRASSKMLRPRWIRRKSKYNKLKAQERQILASAAGNSGNSGSYGNGRFMWPTVSHRYITAEYGQIRSYERHPGMDIAGIGYGSRIMASASGKVVLSGWYGGYGYCVIVDHGSIGGGKHLYSLYGHNSSLAVSIGQNVSKGQTIAYAGSTGWSTGTHCHWEVRIGRSINSYYTVNPRNYL